MSDIKSSKGLGRLHAPDERDKKFLIKHILAEEPPKIQHKYWGANAWWGDQGDSPQCVGYGWAHWIEDGPVNHTGNAPIIPPDKIYNGAQNNDEWAGDDYQGTSVRGGAKYLQSIGAIKEYRWSWDINELINAVLTLGPVIVGTNWYDSMFYPVNEYGLIKISAGIAGGHCYKLDGISLTYEVFRIKNSWGRSWGHNGFAHISFKDMERLINEDGEVCLAIENEKIAL